jgi:hypothetical protein
MFALAFRTASRWALKANARKNAKPAPTTKLAAIAETAPG